MKRKISDMDTLGETHLFECLLMSSRDSYRPYLMEVSKDRVSLVKAIADAAASSGQPILYRLSQTHIVSNDT